MNADHAIQEAIQAQAAPLASVSAEALAGEILRRTAAHVRAHDFEKDDLNAETVEHVANKAGLFFNRPDKAQDTTGGTNTTPATPGPIRQALKNFLSGIFTTAQPIVLSWIANNLPAILAALLANAGGVAKSDTHGAASTAEHGA